MRHLVLISVVTSLVACDEPPEARTRGPFADVADDGETTGGSSTTDATTAAADTGEPSGPTDEGSTGETPTDDPPPVDPCSEAPPPACPSTSAPVGSGLVAIDRCPFPIAGTPESTSYPLIIEALAQRLPVVSLADVVADGNRSVTQRSSVPGNPKGLAYAFEWDATENDKDYWIPQGITGTPDAGTAGADLVGGRKVIAVSWYYKQENHSTSTGQKGSRISFVDLQGLAAPRYRMVLLVQPTGTAQAPDFAPVKIHVGGIAWVGDKLWVADTGKGFRVFDLTRIMQVPTDGDEIGCASGTCRGGLYKYVLPQVAAVYHGSECGPRFSWVSVDRSAEGLHLVSGEYCSTSSCAGEYAGRLFRWPIREDGHLVAPQVWPVDAWLMGHKQIQGGAWIDGTAYLSSSAPAFGRGELNVVRTSGSVTNSWSEGPEDLMIDNETGWLWSLSEHVGERFVYASDLDALSTP